MDQSFYYKDGYFYCENLQINNLLASFPKSEFTTKVYGNRSVITDVPTTPLYIYSSNALKQNVNSYKDAFKKLGINGILGYAAKANSNSYIIEHLKDLGVEMLITVSGYEILNGLKVGFEPKQIIFNGNGKQFWEIKLAISEGVLLNVDSAFDAQRIASIASMSNKSVQVLLRVRPLASECSSIDVHPYVNTSGDSKFGFDVRELDEILETLRNPALGCNIEIVGIHCHLGSCIIDPQVISYTGQFLVQVQKLLEEKGVKDLRYLNIGGGIGVDYYQIPFGMDQEIKSKIKTSKVTETACPSPEEFMKNVSSMIPDGVQVIIEPGRSLVGNAGIIVTSVLGVKSNTFSPTKYIVTDAGMTELIRPSLYGSHHFILPTKLDSNPKVWDYYDIVGPVCESGDFLGKNHYTQSTSEYLAILTSGAYGSSMSSNYNMRPKVTEILVQGSQWNCIRERQTFDQVSQWAD